MKVNSNEFLLSNGLLDHEKVDQFLDKLIDDYERLDTLEYLKANYFVPKRSQTVRNEWMGTVYSRSYFDTSSWKWLLAQVKYYENRIKREKERQTLIHESQLKRKKRNKVGSRKIQKNINAETKLLRFKKECEAFQLPKGATIPRETLFEIMVKIGLFAAPLDEFTTKCNAYIKAREYASRLGYSKKGSALFEK